MTNAAGLLAMHVEPVMRADYGCDRGQARLLGGLTGVQ